MESISAVFYRDAGIPEFHKGIFIIFSAPKLTSYEWQDLLRDEGEAFANKLRATGVPTAYRCFPGELQMLAALPPDTAEWQTLNEDTRMFMKKYW